MSINQKFIYLIIFLLGICMVSPAVSQERGIVPVPIKDRSGNQVLLYQESHALLVGVSEYTKGWPNLPGVKEDINEVKVALEQKGFHTVIVMNPTRVELRDSIENFINLYGQDIDNRLIFYFAGHGHTMESSYGEEMGYFVPANAPNPNIDEFGFRTTSINMESIEVYSKKVQSKHALFLFDSCFSGSIFALSRAIPENISFKTSKPVRQFITAGSANETVPDESIFNDQLIRALNGEGDLDGDGYLTGVELGEFLNKTVINYSKGSQHPQYGKIRNPNLDKGDFVFSLLNREHIEKSVDSIIREREKLEQDRSNLEKKRKRITALQRMQKEKQKLEEERKRLKEEQDQLARLQQPFSPLRDFSGSGGSGDSGFFSEEPILEQGFSSGGSSSSNYARQRKTKLAPPNIFAMDHTPSADFSNGKRIYNKTARPMACKMCHGKNGDGGGKLGKALKPPPSDFTSMKTMEDISPGQMYWVIKNGSRGTGMLGHSRTLKDKEIWDVVKYIRQSWVRQNNLRDKILETDVYPKEFFSGKTGKLVRVMTKGTPLRVRAVPSFRSKVVAQVPQSSILPVIQENTDWFQIEYKSGKMGWITKKYSQLVRYNPKLNIYEKVSTLNLDLLRELQKLAKLDASPVPIPDVETEESAESSESYDSIMEKFDSLLVEPETVTEEVPSGRLDSSRFQSKLRPLPKASQTKYVKMVQEKIYKNWREPFAGEYNRNAVVSFFIFPNGNIDKPFIKQSSGVENLDTLSVRAVMDSAPFPKFPKNLNRNNLHININFKYVSRSSESRLPMKTEGQKIQKQPLNRSGNYSDIVDHLGSLGSKHGIRKLEKP